MSGHDPRAVANEFLELNEGPMELEKLHNLVYIAHGFNLAFNDEPLLEGKLEAYDEGPVAPAVKNHLEKFGSDKETGLLMDKNNKPFRTEFSEKEKNLIESVWQFYGLRSGLALSKLNYRSETPWGNAYRGPNARIYNVSQSLIKGYFRDKKIEGAQNIQVPA